MSAFALTLSPSASSRSEQPNSDEAFLQEGDLDGYNGSTMRWATYSDRSSVLESQLRRKDGFGEAASSSSPEKAVKGWSELDGYFNRCEDGTKLSDISEISMSGAGEPLLLAQRMMMEVDEWYEKQVQLMEQLTAKTGMPFTQEIGQRNYGPPPDFQGPPAKASEVFVGGIPRDCMESELVPVLEKAGQIWQIRLMIASGGQNRGYCFVNYQKPEEAARACQILNNYEIRPGCQIGVLKSADSHSMFLGGIPKDKTSAEVFDEIKNITAGVIEANVVPAYQSRDLNKGYAYVEYESHKAAAMAIKKMKLGNIQLWGMDACVDWANSKKRKRMQQRSRDAAATLHIENRRLQFYRQCEYRSMNSNGTYSRMQIDNPPVFPLEIPLNNTKRCSSGMRQQETVSYHSNQFFYQHTVPHNNPTATSHRSAFINSQAQPFASCPSIPSITTVPEPRRNQVHQQANTNLHFDFKAPNNENTSNRVSQNRIPQTSFFGEDTSFLSSVEHLNISAPELLLGDRLSAGGHDITVTENPTPTSFPEYKLFGVGGFQLQLH